MKIYDIPQATKITINLVYRGKCHTVEATALTQYGEGLLITPVICDGNMMEECHSANFEYEEAYTGKRHLFQADAIKKAEFAGTFFHVVEGREIVLGQNRRKAERYEVQILGSAMANDKANMSVVLVDISMRGFSLMIGKSGSLKVGDRVKVDFIKPHGGRKLTLRGVVVRGYKIGEFAAVGCETEMLSPYVVTYIMELKREFMASAENGSDIKVDVKVGAAV